MHRVDVMAEHCGGVAACRHMQRLGGDEGIAVTVAADPAPDAQETCRAGAKLLFPARIKLGDHGHEHVAQIGQRIVDLVGDEQFFGAQRPRLPQQHDLAADCLLDDIALGGFLDAGIA